MRRLALAGLLLGAAAAVGPGSVGTRSAQFLKLGVSARAIGMGEAVASLSNGPSSLHYNPAGIARTSRFSLSFTQAFHLQTIKYSYAAMAVPTPIGAIGTSALYLYQEGIESFGDSGERTGTFQPSDLALSVGWAKEFGLGRPAAAYRSEGGVMRLAEGGPRYGSLSVGISAKWVRQKIVHTANALAVDAGVRWAYRRVALGAALQNFGTKLRFIEKGESLPTNLKFGASYQVWKPLLLAAEVNLPSDAGANVRFGTEYVWWISPALHLAPRLGYRTQSSRGPGGLAGLSTGAGLGWRDLSVDFGFVPFGELGNTYRVSFDARF